MQGTLFSPKSSGKFSAFGEWSLSRQMTIGLLLVVALFAFEIFNYDTTRYALNSLLGGVQFIGLGWATILAVAFCAIDFAGLAHMFTPQRGRDEPKEVWFLMGAWLLGATMNALMTWWAVSLTVLNHPFIGNEVLSRAQLLQIVPIFVAVLVWLTRIMFIGALSIAGDHLFRGRQANATRRTARNESSRPNLHKQAQTQPNRQSLPTPNVLGRRQQRPPTPAMRQGRRTPAPPFGSRQPATVGMRASSAHDDAP